MTERDDPRPLAGIAALLETARARLRRLAPDEVEPAIAEGAGLVDIRPEWQRRLEGEIPGSVIIERNHLEWRLDPGSPDRIDGARPGRRWIIFCSEGYTSSLAADVLNSIGVPATDIVGGFHAWVASGGALTRSVTAVGATVR